ncbi:M23 family metallopeptidase [Rhodococcus pyridinivorans]|uniref:Peptidase n=3 Tax=Rhodococcus TaxID=1827 RepID=V9XDK1_9NOCA|nr:MULTISPECIES: M23 family metallopeptidase [Rhodococcus]AHD19392.1 peptidase [Rhodococcus pyridinivorans SB3094]MCT7290002.1 M23 family metallopeptidase [Rhodococcus sp. PAE-6]QOW00500.1 M23 family metallopeptidase [Rhodococcus pyridinivorans]USI92026.1 M23 family metallopeptidase [Rhodococcus pyridinivorans]UTM38900.1 M23 family metallopeptidase [Rhodococcus pyridinivorans]
MLLTAPLRSLAVVIAVVVVLTAAPGPGSADAGRFVWPLDPRPVVSRQFDPPEQNWLPGHRGVDLDAHVGQTVVAAGDGVVAFAGVVAGKPVVSVDHEGGLRTTYEPVEAAVAAGRRVTRGDPIGTVVAGHDGCASPACLHWGLRRGRDDYLDPLPLVERPVIRLLPV